MYLFYILLPVKANFGSSLHLKSTTGCCFKLIAEDVATATPETLTEENITMMVTVVAVAFSILSTQCSPPVITT